MAVGIWVPQNELTESTLSESTVGKGMDTHLYEPLASVDLFRLPYFVGTWGSWPEMRVVLGSS